MRPVKTCFRTATLQLLTLNATDPCSLFYIPCLQKQLRNTTPPWQSPHRLASTTRPFVKVCSLAKSQKRLLLTQRRYVAFSSKDRSSRKKKRKKKRRSFIMELRNCKLSKYNRRPLARRPELTLFCLRHRASAVWPEYRITSNQSNSYLNETSNEKKFLGYTQ